MQTLPWYLHLAGVLAWIVALLAAARLGGRNGREARNA